MVVASRLVLTLCVVTAGTVTGRADDAATIAAIAERYGKLCDSLHCVDAQYFSREVNSTGVYEELGRRVRDGDRRLLSTDGPSMKLWMAFDGRYGYSVSYGPEVAEFPSLIVKTKTCPKHAQYWYSVDHWLGVTTGEASPTLLEMLASPQCRVLDRIPYEDEAAWRIDLGEVEDSAEFPSRYEARFSAKYDGWPIEIRCFASERRPASQRYDSLVRTATWQRVADPLLGADRWFPLTMQRTLELADSVFTLELTQVTLNKSPPQSIYAAAPQPGTHLQDETVPGQPKVTIYQPDQVIKQQIASASVAEPAPPPIPSGVVARPDSGVPLWAVLRWLCVAALAGAAGWYALKQARS